MGQTVKSVIVLGGESTNTRQSHVRLSAKRGRALLAGNVPRRLNTQSRIRPFGRPSLIVAALESSDCSTHVQTNRQTLREAERRGSVGQSNFAWRLRKVCACLMSDV
jgi:hypothetical protein